MIKNRKDYEYYLLADRIAMGRLPRKHNFFGFLKTLFFPDHNLQFVKTMRKIEYLENFRASLLVKVVLWYYYLRYRRLSIKLGFMIQPYTFGPGVSLKHYGFIAINSNVRIGSNCVLHPGVSIGTQAGYGSKTPVIGNNVYIGPGAVIYGEITIGNNIAIGANAVVNKSFIEEGVVLGGVPAKIIGKVDIEDILLKATDLIDKNIDYQLVRGKPAIEAKKIIKGLRNG